MQIETIKAADCARAAFTIDAGEFHAAAKLLAGKLIEKRNTIPILAHIRIAASLCGQVELTASNLDQMATITLAGEVESPGAICVQGDALGDALAKAAKSSKGARARLQDIDGRAVLNCGRPSVKLASLPVDDFPTLAMPEPCAYGPSLSGELSLPADTLLRDMATLAPLMDKGHRRYYLEGVAMQRREVAGRDCLAFVATDGGNIGAALRDMPEGAGSPPDMILPAGAVLFLKAAGKAKACGDLASFSYHVRAGRAAITIGNLSLVTKLIDGTYPDWTRLYRAPAPIGEADAGAAMFPGLLPGAPIAAMGAIEKACPVAVDWKPDGDMFIGRSAKDAGLYFASMACPDIAATGVKGFSFHVTGEREAESYLLALAQSRGLPSIEEIAARCEAINAAYGPADNDSYNGKRAFGEAKAQPAKLVTRGPRVLGVTIAGEHRRAGWREMVQDWETLATSPVDHPAALEPVEGSYSILMPADGPGQLTAKGDGEIIGPDGIAYPVAMNDKAIHLTKDQVRALMDSPENWAVVEFAGVDGKPRYVSQIDLDSGDAILTARQKNGRVWPSTWCKRTCRAIAHPQHETFTREAVEAVIAGEPVAAPIVEVEAPTPIEAIPAPDAVELPECGPLSAETQAPAPVAHVEPESAPAPPEIEREAASEPATDGETCNPAVDLQAPADPLADVLARLDAVEAVIATLSVKSEGILDQVAPLVDQVTPSGEVARPKRTAAHERAVRRAWAERKARRVAQFDVFAWETGFSRETLRKEEERKVRHDTEAKRRRAVLKARDLHRQAKAERAALAKVTHGRETANRKWRAAEVANAALQQRAERAEKAAGDIAGRIAAIENQLHRATA